MREDLLKELEAEYETRRDRNEREENARREKIRNDYPQIENAVEEREELVFGTIRRILDGKTGTGKLKEDMEKMNARISGLLLENGLPEDYLAPVYSCPFCRDTGYTGDTVRTPCECLKKAYKRKIREQIGLGKTGNESFETYSEDLIPNEPIPGTGLTQRQISRYAREQCEKWADRYPHVQHRDILLTGGSGLGKTFLMHSMAGRLIERGEDVLLVSAYTFLQMARKSHFEAENGVQDLMEVPVLMLDDLGSEPLMQNVTVEQLFHLINERQARGLSTVISTNLTLQELKERYTERIASRLNNPKNCLILTLAGKDLRKLER